MSAGDAAAAAVASASVAAPSASAAAAASSAASLPAFVAERLALWESLRSKQPVVEKQPITVTLPDGRAVEATAGVTTALDIAKSLSVSLAKRVVVAQLDNDRLWDAWRPLESSCRLRLITFDDEEGKHTFWHSSAHVLGQAMEIEFGAHLCIGPPVKEGAGFYYDARLDNDAKITEDDYARINARVAAIIKEAQPFERFVVSKQDALELFKYNKYKVEIVSTRVADGDMCTVYRCGPLIDLCRGPHVPTTAVIQAMEVTKNSAAYWNGDAKNDSLQRVYGVSFPDKKQLKEYLVKLEEAKKRDHRIIGTQQELFFFRELSPGSAFFMPHGTRIYMALQEMIRREYWLRNYTDVITPNMFNVQLWKTSGHYQHYRKNMFEFQVEEQPFALKPMNCPGHCVVFASRARSYRELPIRMCEFGVLHRNEYSGALTGLTRVRRFVQDDAHIFCRLDQVKAEIKGCLDFLQCVYGRFGFRFELELSTRPEDSMGELETWERAEAQLKEVLDEFGQPWKINPGDGAFYGPKIDIGVFDALLRRHQCATIQLDFQLPINFNLEFKSADTQKDYERPVMIHRAILGSVERMIAILCEHWGGKWPLWLSPRQVCVVPVKPDCEEFCEVVRRKFHDAHFYVDVDLSGNTFNKKIREAQVAQYNFILVVGDKEVQNGTVNVRTRDNVTHGEKKLDEAVEMLSKLRSEFQ